MRTGPEINRDEFIRRNEFIRAPSLCCSNQCYQYYETEETPDIEFPPHLCRAIRCWVLIKSQTLSSSCYLMEVKGALIAMWWLRGSIHALFPPPLQSSPKLQQINSINA